MTDVFHNLVEREPRYQVNSDELGVCVEKTIDGQVQKFKGQLLDLSSSGVRLKLDCAVKVAEVLRLELEADALSGKLTVSGEVCWMTPHARGEFVLGCTFSPNLPDETFDALFADRALDRRCQQRVSVDLQATAKWELERDHVDVSIINFSEDGLCLRSQEKGKPGNRVLVMVEPDGTNTERISVVCKGQWQVEAGNSYIIGCAFCDMEGYGALKERAKAHGLIECSKSLWRRLIGRD